MTKMTLTEALVKLKLLNSKIEDAQRRTFVGFAQVANNKLPAGYTSEEQFKTAVQGAVDMSVDLISFRDTLKAKVALANATTEVKVGEANMTIAEAIERKNSLKYKLSLLNHLKAQKTALENQVNNHNAIISAKADNFVVQMYQQSSASLDEKNKAKDGWIAQNSAKLLTDPKVEATIQKLEKEINDFQTNVDVALSVVNAKTEISV